MTRQREARPEANGTGRNTQVTGGDTGSDATAYAAAIRRRRAASWRCPPLDCGRRDPLDPDRRPALARRRAEREQRRAELERESWQAATAHLRAAGYDVAWVAAS